MDITKCLTISTSHVTKNTMNQLEKEPYSDAMGLSVYKKADFGYWIWCRDDMIEYSNNGENIPSDLWRCMLLALKYDCRWLCLDCDGDVIDNLETFEE